MNPDRLARIARLPHRQILQTLRACDLYERLGFWTREEAHILREAIRARAAELSEPVAEA